MSKIVCLTGLGGSGKSEITRALENDPKIGIVRLGEEVRRLRREEKTDFSTEEYAEKYRFSSVCETFKEEIKSLAESKEILIVDSVRTMADYCFFQQTFENVKLIMIVADRGRRLDWLKSRNRTGDPKSELKLAGHDYWELDFGISSLFGVVDKFFVNEGSVGILKEKVVDYIFNSFDK